MTPTFWISLILSTDPCISLFPPVCPTLPYFSFTETCLFLTVSHKHTRVMLFTMTSGITPGNDFLKYLLIYIGTSISGLFLPKMSFISAIEPHHWDEKDPQKKEEAKSIPSLNLFPDAYLLLYTWALGTRIAHSTMTAVCLGSRERGMEARRLGGEACRMALVCP